ncbi:MAG: lipoyl domain-containing protein [Anaerolineae bacterium]|nr:lipoyl domain-containing protein [Anaerolineae bacterium]
MARTPVYMPKFGMTMTEALIVEWHFKPGDPISAGDVLVTIETEKVNEDLEASVSGTLVELLYPADEEVPVGEIIAYIDAA